MAEAEAGAILPRFGGTRRTVHTWVGLILVAVTYLAKPCTIFKSRRLKSRLAAVDRLGFIFKSEKDKKKNFTASNWEYMLSTRVLGTGKRLLALRLLDLSIDQSPS